MVRNTYRRADTHCNRSDIEEKKESSILGSFLGMVVKSFDSVNADKTFYIHEICDAEGNNIQMAGEGSDKK